MFFEVYNFAGQFSALRRFKNTIFDRKRVLLDLLFQEYLVKITQVNMQIILEVLNHQYQIKFNEF
jgi:hypothetical protein